MMPSSTAEDQSRTVTGYPAATGYPQPQPGYPPSYSSYPNTSNGYPYSAPPPAASYPSQPYGSRSRSTTFFRILAFISIASSAIFFGVSFIMWLAVRPLAPVFRVNSLSVSTFNLSKSQLTSKWDVGLAVANPNKKINFLFDSVETFVFYGNDVLAVTSVEPFYLGKMNQGTVYAKFATNSVFVDELVAQKIAGDRSRGVVSFNVRTDVSAGFKARWWPTRHKSIKVFCENLNVRFLSATGEGMLVGGTTACIVNL